jgi:hypothetical protein
MGHEKKFEGFPGPAYTVLHADLLHYSEEFVYVTDPWLIPMSRYGPWCPVLTFRNVELCTVSDIISKKKKSHHPFNIYTNRPNRDPHFGDGKLGILVRKNQDNLKSKPKVC